MIGRLSNRVYRTRSLGRRSLLSWALLFVWALARSADAGVALEPGQRFPDLEFERLESPGDYALLGLRKSEGSFRLAQIPGDVLLLEFFNKHCVPCQKQVRFLEEVHRRIREGDRAGRVRILAVGVGNAVEHLGRWRQRRGISYPVTGDPEFEHWQRLGDPGKTPFTVRLVRRGPDWIVQGYEFGVQSDDALEEGLQTALAGVGAPVRPNGGESAEEATPEVRLSEEDRIALAGRLLERITGVRRHPEKIVLPGGQEVYRTAGPGGDWWYVRIARRPPICEVCHPVHFLVAFDAKGRVRGFETVHVTKYGNDPWSAEDVRFFSGRLEGKSMSTLKFDPEVDAVTEGTMSSAIIFDEIRRTAELLSRLGS